MLTQELQVGSGWSLTAIQQMNTPFWKPLNPWTWPSSNLQVVISLNLLTCPLVIMIHPVNQEKKKKRNWNDLLLIILPVKRTKRRYPMRIPAKFPIVNMIKRKNTLMIMAVFFVEIPNLFFLLYASACLSSGLVFHMYLPYQPGFPLCCIWELTFLADTT